MSYRNVKRFRGGLVFRPIYGVSLKSRLESNKEEEEVPMRVQLSGRSDKSIWVAVSLGAVVGSQVRWLVGRWVGREVDR